MFSSFVFSGNRQVKLGEFLINQILDTGCEDQIASKQGRSIFLYSAMRELVCNRQLCATVVLRQLWKKVNFIFLLTGLCIYTGEPRFDYVDFFIIDFARKPISESDFYYYNMFDIARLDQAMVSFLVEFSSSLLGGSVKLTLLQLYEMWELDFLMLSEYQFSEALGSLLTIIQRVYLLF